MTNWTINIEFFLFLREIDLVLAKKAKDANCPLCGGVLDVSNYERQPRGLTGTDPCDHTRFSFTCRRCNKRVTPPSVRFLGRKVYVGAFVILAISAEWLQANLVKVCRQTLKRWRRYWNEVLHCLSQFWRKAKSLLPPDFQSSGSPIAVLDLFLRGNEEEGVALSKCLDFFSPLSVWRPSG